MRVSVDKKVCAPLVLCFTAVCALTFLIIPTAGSASNGGACDGNTAKTISVLDEFNNDEPDYLNVESSLQCDSYSSNCAKYDPVTRSDYFTLSDVLEGGQTPGDLIVSFTGSGTQDWSQGFTSYIDCESGGDCAAGAKIEYLKDSGSNPQRSVYTKFNYSSPDSDHNAVDWIIDDIADNRDEVRLKTVASSSIGV